MNSTKLKQDHAKEFFFTVYPHAYTRVIRPLLSPSAQSIFSCFVEKSFGYHIPESNYIFYSYSRLREDSGIIEDHTIRSGLKELIGMELLIPTKAYYKGKTAKYKVNFNLLRSAQKYLIEEKMNPMSARVLFKQTSVKITEVSSVKITEVSEKPLQKLQNTKRNRSKTNPKTKATAVSFFPLEDFPESNDRFSEIIKKIEDSNKLDNEQKVSLRCSVNIALAGNNEAREHVEEVLKEFFGIEAVVWN